MPLWLMVLLAFAFSVGLLIIVVIFDTYSDIKRLNEMKKKVKDARRSSDDQR